MLFEKIAIVDLIIICFHFLVAFGMERDSVGKKKK
jgi:hypothetical protein